MYVETRRRFMVSGLCVATSLALVSACTSGDADGPGAQRTTDSTIPTFTFALGQMPTSLNGMSTKTETTQITALVTEPLERVSLKDGQVKLTPNLATSAVERDATTVVYKLRKGTTFSNGKLLTPADVVWSFEAAAAPTAETAGNLSGFKSAKATGADEVTITWKYPVIGLRAFLASVLIQEAAFGKAHPKDLGTSAALPIGTGPYAYERQTSQDVTLVRNSKYWGQKPKPDKVKFTVISDASAGQLAMRSGSLQGARVADPKTAAQWKGAGASLTEVSTNDSNLLSMDTSKAPFDDIHVRKAVAASLDVKGVMAAAFGTYATRLNTLVPDTGLIGAAGSAEEAASFTKQLPTYEFDLDKAKSELAKSKHADGFAVTVPYINSNQWQKLLALNLQQNMKKIGVTITPKPVPPGQWFKDIFSHQATGIQLFSGFTSPIFDPSGLMSSFVGKANMKPNAVNAANFTTPVIEKNYPLVAPETSAKYPRAQRWKATQAILKETAEQVPYVPLFTEQDIYAAGNGAAFQRAPQTVELSNGAWIDLVRSTK